MSYKILDVKLLVLDSFDRKPMTYELIKSEKSFKINIFDSL